MGSGAPGRHGSGSSVLKPFAKHEIGDAADVARFNLPLIFRLVIREGITRRDSPRLPHHGTCWIGAHLAWVTPGMNTECVRVHRRRNVHRPAVHAYAAM